MDLSHSSVPSTGLFEGGLKSELSWQARFLSLRQKVFDKVRFLFSKKNLIGLCFPKEALIYSRQPFAGAVILPEAGELSTGQIPMGTAHNLWGFFPVHQFRLQEQLKGLAQSQYF